MSSRTDEDEDGGTRVPSLTVTFMSRRRCARGQCRVWTSLPHYPGLSQIPNPMPYPPQVKFPPPPIMTPIPMGVPPPLYSLPPPPLPAPLTPAPPVTQAVAPAVQANVASVTIPTPCSCSESSGTSHSSGDSGRGDHLTLHHPNLQDLNQGPQLILTLCQLVDLPPPQHPQYGGAHLNHGSQLVDSTSQI